METSTSLQSGPVGEPGTRLPGTNKPRKERSGNEASLSMEAVREERRTEGSFTGYSEL